MLKINKLSKSFGDTEIFKDISFEVNSGEIVALIGKSGCGKTSLANIILNFDVPDSGTISLYNSDLFSISDKDRKKITCTNIQMIFQDAQNVLHPLKTVKQIFTETKKSMAK